MAEPPLDDPLSETGSRESLRSAVTSDPAAALSSVELGDELTSGALSFAQHVALWQAVVVLALIAGLHPSSGLRTALLVLSAVIGAGLLVSDGLVRRNERSEGQEPRGERSEARAASAPPAARSEIEQARAAERRPARPRHPDTSPDDPFPHLAPDDPKRRVLRPPMPRTPVTASTGPAASSGETAGEEATGESWTGSSERPEDAPTGTATGPELPGEPPSRAGRWAIVGEGERERWLRALERR